MKKWTMQEMPYVDNMLQVEYYKQATFLIYREKRETVWPECSAEFSERSRLIDESWLRLLIREQSRGDHRQRRGLEQRHPEWKAQDITARHGVESSRGYLVIWRDMKMLYVKYTNTA